MRIRRLDITGFKSFMDRTVLSFDEGVTGIVGPNGCGKSNVVDAIRWVMGEQSAKHLRGRGMEDVIFNGSETHAPLSMAEVSMTMRLEEGDVLPQPYAGMGEVMVTRRLFRSGESEYLINKTTARLLDIVELFLGTGVGKSAYSIIEQGRVGLIVSSKPEDRRAFIEEAAGVTKYKSRRKAAERKMEYTQQNLLRVNDIVSELERRLDQLARQARKAEKYKKLKAEAREIELHGASHRWLELTAEQKVLAHRLEGLTADEKKALEEVRALEEQIASRRTALDAANAELEGMAAQVHGLEGQVQLDDQNLAHSGQDLEATARRLEQAHVETEALLVRQAELAARAASLESERQGRTASLQEEDVALKVLEEEIRRATALEAEVASRLEKERAELLALAAQLANHEANLANLGQRAIELGSRRAQNRAEAQVLVSQEAALSRTREEVSERVGQSRQAALSLAHARGEEEASLTRTREAFAENEIDVIRLREELADKRSRLSSLEEIARNYEGYDRGVRAVMRKAGEDPRAQGILGLVADVVATTPEFEKAIEAALGERLQHVIVESRQRGIEWLEFLKGASEGRSSFLPIDSLELAAPAEPDLGQSGVLAAAWTQVRCDESLLPLVQALLGGVVIVRDLAAARAYLPLQGQRVTLVTLDGDVFRSDGLVTGGVLEGPAVGALQKRREIAELQLGVVALEGRYNEIVTRHYSLQKEMGRSEGVLKGLAKNQHVEELNVATQEKDLHKAAEDLARLRDQLTQLDAEDQGFAEQLTAVAGDEEASRGEVAHAQADRSRREELLRELTAELEALKQRGVVQSEQATALKVRIASGTDRLGSIGHELSTLAQQRTEVVERTARVAEAEGADRARHGELEARIAQTRGQRELRAAELADARSRHDARKAQQAQEAATVRELDGQLRELRGHLDTLTQGLSALSLRERELVLELEHLVRQIDERHQTNLLHELHRFHVVSGPDAGAEQRLRDLRAQIERMGEINLTAIEEHQELAKRHEFLAAQKGDLESSITQLKSAIVKIDRTSRERFQQTFDMVNEKFQQVFPRLFGGGRASLVLTDEGPGIEQGVEIVAQPPGKKLQSVSLFSGGEKALTAVALIFAIFLIKPTPFCLLDEVDAPLDEINVGRYNDMVREMCRQSQFILITHNKRTMEVVDTLYGVTMEEPGISKVVSVRMREAAAANNDAASGAS